MESAEPDTSRLPSLLRATLYTRPVWPCSVDVHAPPDLRSHTLLGEQGLGLATQLVLELPGFRVSNSVLELPGF